MSDESPKKINLNNSIVSLSLKKPLKEADGSEIKELSFTELCVEDFIQYDQRDLSQVKIIVELIGRITGTRQEILKKMSAPDYISCAKIINDFFEGSHPIQSS